MLKFNQTEFLTKDGKKVFSLNKDYNKVTLDSVKDKSGRVWSQIETTYKGDTTTKWVAEDASNRFSLSGDFSKAEIKALEGNLIVAKEVAEIAQSDDIAYELEGV